MRSIVLGDHDRWTQKLADRIWIFDDHTSIRRRRSHSEDRIHDFQLLSVLRSKALDEGPRA